MSVPAEEIKSLARLAAEEADDIFDYGDLVSKQWLLDRFGISLPQIATQKMFDDLSFMFLEHMEEFRNIMLVDYKKHLFNVRGQGYMICQPNQQVDLAMVKFKKSINTEINVALRVLNNINETLLDSAQIGHRDTSHGKIAAVQAFCKTRLT